MMEEVRNSLLFLFILNSTGGLDMESLITYFTDYTIVDLFTLIAMLIVCVRGIERILKWIADKLSTYYKRKRGVEEKEDTINSHTEEIKKLTERIDRFVSTVEHHYSELIEKVEEQQKQLDRYESEGKQRDRAVLRDRISGGMRFFEQNRDVNGLVHISVSDHENMEELFKEYFSAGGNGTFKQMYNNEFKKFIIDK
jgi:predicted RNase H-like nuclease (RuvC/YqgF family)